jgi:hypothetical protein
LVRAEWQHRISTNKQREPYRGESYRFFTDFGGRKFFALPKLD